MGSDRPMPDILVVVPAKNGAGALGLLLPILLGQQLPAGRSFQIGIVDDGSDDETAAVVAKFEGPTVLLLRNATSRGRASACNQGAAAAKSRYVALLDVDCEPVDSKWLHNHLEALESGAELSLGPVLPRGHGFWESYLRDVAARRDAAARAGDLFSLTTANLAVNLSTWRLLGGFDENYKHYGFEDRDLLARALDAGVKIRYASAAAVTTMPPSSVEELTAKSELSGRYTAPLFRNRHAARYRRMAFWLFDSKVGPWFMRWTAPMLSALARPATAAARWLAASDWVPRFLRLFVVRLAVGLRFLRGTMRDEP
jgi:glycosyltransferase involved in cell wall biosynthesis